MSECVCVFKESAGREEVSPLLFAAPSSSSSLLVPRTCGWVGGLVQLTSVLLQSSEFKSLYKNEVNC